MILTESEINSWKKKLSAWSQSSTGTPALAKELAQMTSRIDQAHLLKNYEQEKLLFDLERLQHFVSARSVPEYIEEARDETEDQAVLAERLEEIIPKLKMIDKMSKEELKKVYGDIQTINTQLSDK